MEVYVASDFTGILAFAEYKIDQKKSPRAGNLWESHILPRILPSLPEAIETPGKNLRLLASWKPLADTKDPSDQKILLADTPWSGHLSDVAAGTGHRLHEFLSSLPQPGAYALWDKEAEVLTLYRDPTGGRTLFIRAEEKALAFATHPEFLFALYPEKWRLCPEAAAVLFAYGPARPPGNTILCELYELAPGEALVIARRGEDFLLRREHIRLFPAAEFAANPKTLQDISIALRESLFSSVHDAYREGARGVFLSGGLDSSAVLALLRRTAPTEPLFSASIDYEDEDAHFVSSAFLPERDAAYVNIMIRAAKSEHRNVVLPAEAIAASLPEMGSFRGFPGMLDVDAALLLFSRKVAGWNAEVTWLTGEGADETFAGYPWMEGPFLQAVSAHRSCHHTNIRILFPWMRHVEERIALLRPEVAQTARAHLNELLLQALDRTNKHLPENFTSLPNGAPLSRTVLSNAKDAEETEGVVLWASAHTALHFGSVLLERMARAGKATGIKILFPFLDGNVRTFARFARKGDPSQRKPLLRDALAGVVPEEIRLRKKSPFPKSHHPKIAQTLRARGEEILATPHAMIWAFLNREAVLRFFRDPPASMPWFGQLLDATHYAAYLAEVHTWLERIRPRLPDRGR